MLPCYSTQRKGKKKRKNRQPGVSTRARENTRSQASALVIDVAFNRFDAPPSLPMYQRSLLRLPLKSTDPDGGPVRHSSLGGTRRG